MAVVNGNDVGVYVGGDLIGCLTGATLDTSRQEIDVTCKDDSGNRSVILGGTTTSVTFNGNWNPSSSYGLDDLFDIYNDKTEVDLAFGDQTNLTVYTRAYLQQLTWEGPLNAASTFSGTFAATGTMSVTTS
jgi:predicted secreted protein